MASNIKITDSSITVSGVKYHSNGSINKNCLVILVRMIDGHRLAQTVTNKAGYYSITITKTEMSTSTYEIRYFGSGYKPALEPEGDWESFEYVNPNDIIVADQDVQIFALRDWATTVSWCSRAILETFETEDEWDQDNTDDEITISNGILTVSSSAAASSTYVWESKLYDIDEISGQTDLSGKYSLYASVTPLVGGGDIKIEVNPNHGEGADWWTWYDSANSINRNGEEFLAGADDGNGNILVSGINFKVRITFTTDSNGDAGYIDYYAFLADPDLFST